MVFFTFLAGMEGSSSGQDVMWSVFSFLIWSVQESWSPTPYAFPGFCAGGPFTSTKECLLFYGCFCDDVGARFLETWVTS